MTACLHASGASATACGSHTGREQWFDEELYAGLWDAAWTSPSAQSGGAVQAVGPIPPLRIVHVCKYFPPERGGMESYVHDLAQEQALAGHQVTVLAHTATASRRERPPEGYTLLRRRVWFRAGDYVPCAPALAWDLWRVLRGTRPHILHVHCPNPAALWCVLLAPKAAVALADNDFLQRHAPGQAEDTGLKPPPHELVAPKFVVHWHSDVIFPKDRQPNALALRVWRRMERSLLARADRIIATSQPYLESSTFLAPWRDKCVVAPLRLSALRPTVPQGLKHPAVDFLRGPVAGTAQAVLAVGRLAHYKGFDVLLRAVAAAPTLRCCIVGEGEEGPKLRALVRELGVQDRVLLPGEVDDAVLAACYEACDVFCLPSLLRTEAFGMVLLEAQRAGKWCVVSNVPGSGMGTLIENGVNGWLVEPGDVRALACALERLQSTMR